MKSVLRVAMAVTLVAGLTGLTALAQRPQGGGGFGGGFGGGGGPTQLINSKTVLADLKVSDEQTTKLKEWAKEYAAKQGEKAREAFAGFQDLSQEERTKKMQEFQAESTKAAYKGIGEILKEDQVKRLKEIEIQVAGTRAFTMATVAEGLKLTDDQKAKIREISAATNKDLQDLREEYGIRGFGGGFGGKGGKGGGKGGQPVDQAKLKEYQKKADALNKETLTKITATLTDDQKKAWKEMLGAEIDVTKVQEESRPVFTPKKKDD